VCSSKVSWNIGSMYFVSEILRNWRSLTTTPKGFSRREAKECSRRELLSEVLSEES